MSRLQISCETSSIDTHIPLGHHAPSNNVLGVIILSLQEVIKTSQASWTTWSRLRRLGLDLNLDITLLDILTALSVLVLVLVLSRVLRTNRESVMLVVDDEIVQISMPRVRT